ncbi:MAG: ABC transporter permease [Bacteroidales bacterium]|nr:ABC transporter permease [Bacteroidales bacterium]MBN2697267.1 ABC transporter permease [Bacteroidales bacterium]
MARRIIQRFLYALLVLWGVVTVVFLLFNVLPGDPARMLLGQRADLRSVEMIREELGLDKPLPLQYLKYLNDLSPLSVHRINDQEDYFFLDREKYGNPAVLLNGARGLCLVLKAPYLGTSFQNRRQVSEMILDVFPNTLILAVTAILMASLLGIMVGILCAIRKDSWFDRLSIFLSTLGMSLPSFFSAILTGWFFAFVLADFTGLNLTGNITEIDPLGRGIRFQFKNLILPAVTLGIRPLSIFVQLTRNSFLDVLSQDYIRTAKAKGLSFSRIIGRHALRNALNPLITAMSGWFASLMAGVVFVEYIFGWKGLGYLIVDALNQYDMPVVLGSVLIIASVFIVINMLVDLVYAILDPRVRTA